MPQLHYSITNYDFHILLAYLNQIPPLSIQYLHIVYLGNTRITFIVEMS